MEGHMCATSAHGERATEPYLRTRTVHWFDVKWSTDKLKVGDELTLTGRFRLMDAGWPSSVAHPETVYLSVVQPGPSFARVESYINGQPARQSARDLQLGRDYDFTVKLKGRMPGRHHIHPLINVHTAGPLVGPGKWIEVEGNTADFKFPVTTLDGRKIEDLQTWGVRQAVMWHVAWAVLAAIWILWWLRRPLLIPRWIVREKGREDLLVTKADVVFGVILAAVVFGMTAFGYISAIHAYPYTVPLQSGTVYVDPLPKESDVVDIKFKDATYDVPGRSMQLKFAATNKSDKPLTLGEFTTANLRFIDNDVPDAVAAVDKDYPRELVPRAGLKSSVKGPLQPGETRDYVIEATDAAWELERLTSFLTDVDSKMGGILLFYDNESKRHLAEINGPIIPFFRDIFGENRDPEKVSGGTIIH